MILRLTVENGTLAGRTFELTSGFLTIGRGPNCSIRFDPSIERIASKQHAFIEALPLLGPGKLNRPEAVRILQRAYETSVA